MNNSSTLEKMKSMKLNGMVRAFEESMKSGIKANYSADELIGFCIDAEYEERISRKLALRLSQAKLKQNALIEHIDFSASRKIDKNQILRFSDTAWLKSCENIIITGKTGSGKSYLSCAVAHAMCAHGYTSRYENCIKLFSTLKIAKADGSYANEIRKIKKAQVLILDDFGLEPFDAVSRLMLLEILDDRYQFGSTIVAAQIPIEQWHIVIGDATIADAICDRLIHSAHIIELGGENMRRKMKK